MPDAALADAGRADAGPVDAGCPGFPVAETVAGLCGSCPLGALCEGAGCRPVRVAGLEDGPPPLSTWRTLEPALLATAARTISLGYYPSWQGTLCPGSPPPDVVMWTQGRVYSSPLTAPAKATLSGWTAAGVGLVRMEWSAWDEVVRRLPDGGTLPADFPQAVVASTNFSYDLPGISTSVPGHPMTRDLVAPASQGGWTRVAPRPGAEVVLRASTQTELNNPDAGLPVLTVLEPGGVYRLVHVNHDGCYGNNLPADGGLCVLGPDMDLVFRNAILYGGHGL